jgi:hypothetical protein
VRLLSILPPYVAPGILAGCTPLLSGSDGPDGSTEVIEDGGSDGSGAVTALCESVIGGVESCGVMLTATCHSAWLTSCSSLSSYYQVSLLESVSQCFQSLPPGAFCPPGGDAGTTEFGNCLMAALAVDHVAPTDAANRLRQDFCAACPDDASMVPGSCSNFWADGLAAVADGLLEKADKQCTGAALGSFDAGGSLGTCNGGCPCQSVFQACFYATVSLPGLFDLLDPPASCGGGVVTLCGQGNEYTHDCAGSSSLTCGSADVLCDGGTRNLDCTCGGTCVCSLNGLITATFSSTTICDGGPVPRPDSVCPF